MELREKRILDKTLKDFMMDVVPVDLLPYLPCLTRFDKEEVEASQRNHGPTRACCVLVDRLKKRQRGFQQFLQALSQSGSHHVVWLLDPNYYTSHEGEINITLEMQSNYFENNPAEAFGVQENNEIFRSVHGPLRTGVHWRYVFFCLSEKKKKKTSEIRRHRSVSIWVVIFNN